MLDTASTSKTRPVHEVVHDLSKRVAAVRFELDEIARGLPSEERDPVRLAAAEAAVLARRLRNIALFHRQPADGR